MPSPSIPRSSSYPQLSHTRLPPSSRSAYSAPIPKTRITSKLWWEQKIQRLLGRRRDSDLTQESLEYHNRIQETLDRELQKSVHEISLHEAFNAERDLSKYSPYYIRGLTYPKAVVPPSPGPGESQHSSAPTWTSISTFLLKTSGWTFCGAGSKKDKLYGKKLKAQAIYTAVKPRPAVLVTPNELSANSETSNMVVNEVISSTVENIEKPLRERVLEAAAAARPTNIEKVTNESEYILADKYQPQCLEDFICNRDKATQLKALASGGGCGHFIFEGPPGVGKRTMIWAMLREAFGRDTINAREEFKAFDLKGEVVGRIQVHVKQSPQHVEVNLSELKGYEKHVIVELMKETQNKIPNKSALPSSLDNCRALILYEADKLSTDALLYIKWLLERYKGCNYKVFFCCSDVAKLQAIKTICTVVELLPPSKNEIVEVLKFIAKQEGIDLPHELAERFAQNSKNNLRLAIRSFEATWKKGSYPFKEDQVILTGWEDDIADIGKNMIEEQSPKQLYIIRGKLQNLIVHGVSPEFIFKSLVAELKKYLDENLQVQVESMYDEYNRNDETMFDSDKALTLTRHQEEMGKRLNDPSRKHIQQFLRIEEFIAKFMSCYKGCTNTKTFHHDTPT